VSPALFNLVLPTLQLDGGREMDH